MWDDVEYSVRPSEIDEASSTKYVYVRKDITRVEREREEGTEVIYTCKEQKVLKDNWEIYKKLISHDEEFEDILSALIELAEG